MLQFWLIVTSVKEQLTQVDAKGKPVLSDDQAKKDTQALFNRFFTPDAPEALGVDEYTRRETHHNVNAAGRPQPFAFMRAQHLIYTAMCVSLRWCCGGLAIFSMLCQHSINNFLSRFVVPALLSVIFYLASCVRGYVSTAKDSSWAICVHTSVSAFPGAGTSSHSFSRRPFTTST